MSKARRTDTPNLSRDALSRLVFAVDGLRGPEGAPEHLADLIVALAHGSTEDIEREIELLSHLNQPEAVL